MNQFIKLIISCILMFCAVFVWVSVTLVGFMLSFTNWSFMYSLTPFIGLFSVICIIKCAMYVLLKSNPGEYFMQKLEWIRGKAKV